jgi:hypothetical protein
MRWIGCALVIAMTTHVALAEPRGKDLVVDVPGERSRTNMLAIGGVAVGGLLVGSLGVYFNLDAQSAADDVSSGRFKGVAWTDKQDALVDRASRQSTRAGICYGVGGALLAGAIAAYIITEPKVEHTVIHTQPPPAFVAPVPGGAVLGGEWSF